MLLRRHLRIGRGDIPVGTYQYRDPTRPSSVHLCRTVGNCCLPLLVAQQIVRKAELVAENFIVSRRIVADTENNGISIGEVLDSITEPIAFDGSARGVSLGVPPQQYVSASKVIKFHDYPVLVGKSEGRSGATSFN